MQVAERRGVRAILIALSIAIFACLIVAFGTAAIDVNREATLHPARAEREELMAWLARLLFVLGALWILIGAIAARTRLVRRPGAAAARATWLAFSRPWRARESMLGLLNLDRSLMVIVPAGMLIATHLVIASFLSVLPALISSAGWFVFGLVAIALVWPRSPWPLIAAVSGTAMVWSLVLLLGAAVVGPGTWWHVLWTTPWLRVIVMTVGLAVLAWAFVAGGGAVAGQIGARKATGVIIAGFGATIAVMASIVTLLGARWLGSQWLDNTVTVVLEPSLSWLFAVAGCAVFIVGLVIAKKGVTSRSYSPQR